MFLVTKTTKKIVKKTEIKTKFYTKKAWMKMRSAILETKELD